MSFKIQFLLSFLLFFVIADAFNITEILNKYPTYSTFNGYLTQTIAKDINSRSTITVLAVSNDNIGPLSGKSGDDLTGIVSVHVILDYYDMKKLQSMPNKTTTLTTLFQASGKAKGQQGFLLVSVSTTGDVSFASDVAGSSSQGAKLVGSVTSQPYNISVLQVSSVIIPPGIGSPATNSSATNSTTAPSSPPSSTNTSSPVPAPSPRTSTTPNPAAAPKTSPTKSPLSPPAPTPASTPEPSNSTAPTNAPAPSKADAPAPSTGDAPAPSTVDAPAASTDSPATSPDAAADNAPSLGTRLRLNLGAMSVGVLSTLCLMSMF